MTGPASGLDTRASEYLQAVLEKNRKGAESIVLRMVASGTSPLDIFGVLGAAQVEVGRLWESGSITVSDEHFATQVTEECIAIGGDRLKKFRREPLGYAVLCTAEGEFHAVGVRMLAELLRIEGWEADVVVPISVLSLRALGNKNRIDLICISSTIQSSAAGVLKTVERIRSEELLKGAKVLVGGPALMAKSVRTMFEDQGARLIDSLASSLGEALTYALTLRA